MVCWKFLRLFEIGKDLTKLSPKFGTTVVFGTQGHINGQKLETDEPYQQQVLQRMLLQGWSYLHVGDDPVDTL